MSLTVRSIIPNIDSSAVGQTLQYRLISRVNPFILLILYEERQIFMAKLQEFVTEWQCCPLREFLGVALYHDVAPIRTSKDTVSKMESTRFLYQ